MRSPLLVSVVVSLPLWSCAQKAEDNPNWVDDVRPLLIANCARCHGAPTIGGAPAEFRLDRYADQVLPDGRIVHGAATMAEYIKSRAGTLGDMPPDRPRSDSQRDTLSAWFDQSFDNGGPLLGERPGNRAPEARLVEDLPPLDVDEVELELEVSDADADPVSGELYLDGELLSATLGSGRNRVRLDPRTLAEGDHELSVRLSDDLVEEELVLGNVSVAHADGNTAPRVTLPATLRDGLFHDRHSPLPLEFTVEDPDEDDTVTLTVIAQRDGEERTIVEGLPVSEGVAQLNWNLRPIASDTHWRLKVIATDGTSESETTSTRFTVSHRQSELDFDDVAEIFQGRCSVCHPGKQLPGLDFDLARHEDADGKPGVDSLRGIIYRRVILEKNMPPLSAHDILFGFEPMSRQELDTLEEYLLGGAAPPS